MSRDRDPLDHLAEHDDYLAEQDRAIRHTPAPDPPRCIACQKYPAADPVTSKCGLCRGKDIADLSGGFGQPRAQQRKPFGILDFS
jgi:hypothetical protein